ncbi:putative mitochondrial protein [Cucumis melo var. makuwa]|uniref:Mitochondrial protein n=1 Tax=Cucumis melo var. makuwa TaxID=1194695 RepID=A0A5A7UD67_CUCMM|nr:putative mitochondrial protein [Cucumis melo var. makuwa]
MKTINVVVNDNEQKYKRTDDDDDLAPKATMVIELAVVDAPTVNTSVNSFNDSSKSTQKEVMVDVSEIIPSSHVRRNHPSSSIIGDPSSGITTKKKDKIDYAKMIVDICYTSSIEPTSANEAFKDEFLINVMQEELLQFKRNNVWTLVPKSEGANIIGTKLIFKNKTDEKGHVIRNKTLLVVQGYHRWKE